MPGGVAAEPGGRQVHQRSVDDAASRSSVLDDSTDESRNPAPDSVWAARGHRHGANRLWIPHITTIVGLLDVGLSRTNVDKLSKWIAMRIASVPDGGAANELPRLERHFRRAVDCFLEL